jgi:hypothetical protein
MEPLYIIPGCIGFHVEDMYVIAPTGFEADHQPDDSQRRADRGRTAVMTIIQA